jgi:SAM-dependent methyltransferase
MSQPEEQRSTLPGVSEEVRDFYNRYPYPRPIEHLEQYRGLWQDRQKRRADYHLFWPARSYREDHSILIAGCGTSQAAKHALRRPASQVTGIDFSTTSVRCTGELKQRYNLKNLDVYKLPVERVMELGLSFDQIVCTGVLHHMAEPGKGLAALRTVLKPGGAMHLMVYAPYGRAGVYMLQEYCRRLGIQASDHDIRDLAASLAALPRDHPLANLLHNAPDFRSKAALADALLHPQDRAYSVPQFFDFIRSGGMVFGRWLRQAPYLPQCGAIAWTPHATRINRLTAEEQYATLELFRGTMVRHSAIIYRDDSAGKYQPIRFDGQDWRAYVPIRFPETICVQEKLPPGAAAVLINRAHTFTDLYLPIDAQEKQWFDGIDSKSTIEDIMNSTCAHDRDYAHTRTFFEQLWFYDQVVFDTSEPADPPNSEIMKPHAKNCRPGTKGTGR